MIIKTDLLNKIGKQLSLAHLDSFDGTDFSFTCNCGVKFTMNKSNSFVSENQYACFNCKRTGRLAPYVGERYVFRRVRSDAATAGREFSIDFDWFVKVCHMPCQYCGRADINSARVPSKRSGEVLIEHFRYNGLDRINNYIGYVQFNCVPSCIICNRAKNSMSYADFMTWIKTVVEYNTERP